jgi:hypothetical protein
MQIPNHVVFPNVFYMLPKELLKVQPDAPRNGLGVQTVPGRIFHVWVFRSPTQLITNPVHHVFRMFRIMMNICIHTVSRLMHPIIGSVQMFSEFSADITDSISLVQVQTLTLKPSYLLNYTFDSNDSCGVE